MHVTPCLVVVIVIFNSNVRNILQYISTDVLIAVTDIVLSASYVWYVSLVLNPAMLLQRVLVNKSTVFLHQLTHIAMQQSHLAAATGQHPVTLRHWMSWWLTWMRTWVDREWAQSQRVCVLRAANPSSDKYCCLVLRSHFDTCNIVFIFVLCIYSVYCYQH